MGNEKLINVDFPGMNCQIAPYESSVPLETAPGYRKLDVKSAQKGLISALCQQISTAINAETMANAYIVKWPDGVQRELAEFADGSGLMGMSRKNGRIEKYAHLYSLDAQAMLSFGFEAMSVVTSQYYLVEINQQMMQLNQGIDKILEFLYGEKKAELMAEVNFTQYAQKNYTSIMSHDEQRRATIVGLQEARKIAMKDLDFYMSDMDSMVHPTGNSDPVALVDKVMRTKDCLELSMQLYLMSSLMEVYYSRNYDAEYLRFMDSDISALITKCEKHMLGDFNTLYGHIEASKDKIGKKLVKAPLLERISNELDKFNGLEESRMKKGLRKALYSAEKAQEYCITADGAVYLKNA